MSDCPPGCRVNFNIFQSTGIETLEKAGLKNPEVLKYERPMLYIATFTAGLWRAIFFITITVYRSVIKNSVSIYFCPIHYDQKHLTEFNSFKIKIFTTLKRATFCFIFSWQNMQIPKLKKDKAKYICFGLHCGQAIQLQKQKLSCCSLLIVSRHVANINF